MNFNRVKKTTLVKIAVYSDSMGSLRYVGEAIVQKQISNSRLQQCCSRLIHRRSWFIKIDQKGNAIPDSRILASL